MKEPPAPPNAELPPNIVPPAYNNAALPIGLFATFLIPLFYMACSFHSSRQEADSPALEANQSSLYPPFNLLFNSSLRSLLNW